MTLVCSVALTARVVAFYCHLLLFCVIVCVIVITLVCSIALTASVVDESSSTTASLSVSL